MANVPRWLFGFALVACSSSGSTSTTNDATPPGSDARVPAVHRSTAAPCPTDRPASTPSSGGTCSKDADCTTGKNGRCLMDGTNPPSCSYDECVTDSECGSGVCDCRDKENRGANTCQKGNCRIDADCKGSTCSPSAVHVDRYCITGIPLGSFGWFCHVAADECIDDADCKGTAMSACVFDVDANHWKCRALDCVL